MFLVCFLFPKPLFYFPLRRRSFSGRYRPSLAAFDIPLRWANGGNGGKGAALSVVALRLKNLIFTIPFNNRENIAFDGRIRCRMHNLSARFKCNIHNSSCFWACLLKAEVRRQKAERRSAPDKPSYLRQECDESMS